MDVVKIKNELKKKYPDKTILQNPGEIICEVDPTPEHPKYSKAIAVIDQSIPHYHIKATEEYTVLKGTLILTVDGKDIHLPEGQSYIIYPLQHHSAKGDSVWVECTSTPGWTINDHLPIQ